MIFSKISYSHLLLFVLIIGFLLRVINITEGFPIIYISNDEATYHFSALNMLANKTIFTVGNYGPLGAYIQIPFILIGFLTLIVSGVVDSVQSFETLLVSHEGYFLFVPRIISAMFGTLTILLTYLITKELFQNKHIAFFSAFLSSISFNLVHISHAARGWSPAIFFSILGIYFVILGLNRNKQFQKYFFISMISASIAFGFHQFSGTVPNNFLILFF